MSDPLELELGNIKIEVVEGDTDVVWLWIVDAAGDAIEGGAFDYAEFWGIVKAYYEMRV